LKSVTHDIFSLGVGLYLAYHIGRLAPLALLLVVWLAFATNLVIDEVGHVKQGGRPVRSFWTHSIATAPLWGVAIALVSTYLVGRATGHAVGAPQTVLLAGFGVIIACSHLLLDALTEGGVFLARRRVAIAHLRYDNTLLNTAFAAIGLALVFAALL
jgi:hypothetical protein